MFYLPLSKHCLSKEVRSPRSGQELWEARDCTVAGVQVDFMDWGLGFFALWFDASFLSDALLLNLLRAQEKNIK